MSAMVVAARRRRSASVVASVAEARADVEREESTNPLAQPH